MRIHKNELQHMEEHLQYSGPHVWPEISAQMAVDRFLHRRIELSYLSALDRLNTNDHGPEPTKFVLIRLVRLKRDRTNNQSRYKDLFSMIHGVNPNPMEDVRSLLSEIRAVLVRRMPDSPQLDSKICVFFANGLGPHRPRFIGRVMEPWL